MSIRLRGKTGEERHGVTAAASDAVLAAGGHILDYNQFSNLAVCFTIELPPAGIAPLRQQLTALGVELEAPSAEELALAKSHGAGEVAGSLRLDFQHHEPDLRIQIPAVPG